MALTLRTIKGSRLTHEELDGNFRHLTGSHEVSGSITAVAFSGSFSGSFVGDGSGLTGISAGAADLTGTGVVSGSSQLDGSVFGITADIAASGSFSGSFEGDGSGLTGISATAFPHIGEAQITGSLKTTDKVEIYNKAGGSGNILEISAGTAFGTGASGFRFTKNTSTLVNNAHAAFSNLILQVEDGVFNMYRGGAGAKAVITMKSADGHISASLFSGSFAGDGSGLTGVTATPDLTNTDIISGSNLSYDLTTTSWNVSDELNTTGGLYASSKFSVYGSSTTVNGANALWDSATVRYIASTLKFVESPTNNVSKVEIDGTAGAVTASYFTGSFVGDGSGLTGVPAGNVELVPGTFPPSAANPTTGSMILMDDGFPLNGTSPALYIYTGAGATGWQSVQLN